MARPQKVKKDNKRKLKIEADNNELKKNEALIEQLSTSSPAELQKLTKFDDLPLSQCTRKGLKASHFTDLTDVQKECIIPALNKQDLLVAARTGSGKTLGFLIPVLDRLNMEKWTQLDGLGALILTPTRELALQIFEVLKKIGRYHTFSAGLLIGGNNIREEKDRVGRLNILVCTPGRLLQHMDESPSFDSNNLQVLVLDEADRIMDMGFKKAVDAIVHNLPPQRQTMLFSATQTKNVSDLARLSLSKPKYISVVDPENPTAVLGVSETSNSSSSQVTHVPTPKNLEQFYMILPLDEKLDMLWSFIRSHLKSKILVFFSSSKQVRFVYESFRRMQPGIPLLHLHGRQKQSSRMETTSKFMKARSSCLLATDVVARGIDFPEIEWIIQVDCPEDVPTYIHRVGRSARAGKSGKALLMLSEGEKVFVENLKTRRIPITEINVRDSKKASIKPELQAQLFQDPELKYLAQKAFISYVRSVYLQHSKEVFNVENIPLEAFAQSFGLVSAPNVKIKGGVNIGKNAKNIPRALKETKNSDKTEVRTKYDRIFNRQNQNILSEHYQKLNPAEDEDGEDFLNVKRRDHELELDDKDNDDLESDGSDENPRDADDAARNYNIDEALTSKRSQKKALSKKQSLLSSGKSSTKLVFDEEGVAHPLYEFDTEADFKNAGLPEEQRAEFVNTELQEMEQRDVDDKETVKLKRAEKKRRRKELERLAREGAGDSGDEMVARLPSDNENESDSDASSFKSFGSDSDSGSDEEPELQAPPAKRKRFESQESKRAASSSVIEVEEPETLEDLELLSRKLLGH